MLDAELYLETSTARLDIPLRRVLLPSINRWWVIGPFRAPFDTALETVFPPEEKVDLRATYRVKGSGEIAWRKVGRVLGPDTDVTDEFVVNFRKVLGAGRLNAVAYAVTYLHSPADMAATLSVGSDDGVVIWLNGAEVHRHPVTRLYESKQDRVRVHLRQGSNVLMLKVSQREDSWRTGAHLETIDGKPLPEVTVHLAP